MRFLNLISSISVQHRHSRFTGIVLHAEHLHQIDGLLYTRFGGFSPTSWEVPKPSSISSHSSSLVRFVFSLYFLTGSN